MRRKFMAFISIILVLSLLGNCFASELLLIQNNHKKITIAVLNFNSNTGDPEIDAMLSVGTSETIITDLMHVNEIQVVERSRLNLAIEEIKFGLSGFIDEKTAQKAGKFLGAQYVLFGSWQKFSDTIRMNARLVKVETAEIVSSIKKTGQINDIFDMQDKIVFDLLKTIKINVASSVIEKIQEKETNKIEAYKSFSYGLQEIEKGNEKIGIKYMKKAVELDPYYEKPKEYLWVGFFHIGDESVDYNVAPSSSEARLKNAFKYFLVLTGLGGVGALIDSRHAKENITTGMMAGIFCFIPALFIGKQRKMVKADDKIKSYLENEKVKLGKNNYNIIFSLYAKGDNSKIIHRVDFSKIWFAQTYAQKRATVLTKYYLQTKNFIKEISEEEAKKMLDL